jgi:TatD DNase family protein
VSGEESTRYSPLQTLIDSHCHLADAAFADDLDEVVSRARNAGVSQALCVLAMGEPEEAARVPRVAAAWPGLRFAIGIHPHEAGRFVGPIEDSVAAVRRAIDELPSASALGEIGLDYHYDLSPRDVQRELFRAQVRLAGDLHLPLVVHTRDAEDDTIAILDASPAVAGVLHCFTGSERMARWAIDRGWYVSFAGIITFANAATLRSIASTVPLDQLLIETDCPYLAPVPFRGRRNEPAFVVEVARRLANLAGLPLERFRDAMAANFVRLFGAREARHRAPAR